MHVIDAHCDVLSKLLADPRADFAGDASGLDVTLPKLRRSNVLLQCFAIWIPEEVERPGLDHLLKSADLFRTHIASRPEIRFVRSSRDLALAKADGRTGALLTLEGADALNGEWSSLRTMFALGVRCLGLTWNYANWAADGVLEPRKGGLTKKGRALVQECNRMGMIIDSSHLSERGFWELAERSERPFVASHSNAFELCRHPRNLNKEQIGCIIQRGGVIGINFYPPFLADDRDATIDDVVRHIDYICGMGGERAVGLGSDFDGIGRKVRGLEDAGTFGNLAEALAKRYPDELVERIMHKNWFDFFMAELPETEC